MVVLYEHSTQTNNFYFLIKNASIKYSQKLQFYRTRNEIVRKLNANATRIALALYLCTDTAVKHSKLYNSCKVDARDEEYCKNGEFLTVPNNPMKSYNFYLKIVSWLYKGQVNQKP